MSNLSVVLLVCFAVLMLLWGLTLLGAVALVGAPGWLAFFAVLCLGAAVFLR